MNVGYDGVTDEVTYPDKQETRSWLCFGNGKHIHPASYRIIQYQYHSYHINEYGKGGTETDNIDRKNMDT